MTKSLSVTFAMLALAGVTVGARAQSATISDDDHAAPFNYGFGNGVRIPTAQLTLWNRFVSGDHETPQQTAQAIAAMPTTSFVPPDDGPADAGSVGMFGAVLPWPIIPLHMALLPDGQVMTYGTDENGKQGAQLFYDVWDPTQPYNTSHTVLPNTTNTDIFCSGMGLLPNGSLLITGGDLTINNKRNYSNPQANIFTPTSNTLVADGQMNYPRWYPSDVPLVNGDQMIAGGRSNQKPTVQVTTPEYYSVAANTFTPLTGATVTTTTEWFYPKIYLTSSGAIDMVDTSGALLAFTTDGQGSVTQLPGQADRGLEDTPTLMNSPSNLLSIRRLGSTAGGSLNYLVDDVNFGGATPTVTRLPTVPGAGREWSSMTALADGTVFVNGGSSPGNELSNVSYASALYAPATNTWTVGPNAVEPRLYHSAALLLPDGTVLTGGGGAPGPAKELNAEIYYPPYLFAQDGSGNFATRPVIASAPALVTPGTPFNLTMGDETPITNVTMLRLGQVTHSTSLQTRFLQASFTQDGANLTITPSANVNDLLTGYWMIFAFNNAGVPSISAIVDVPPPTQ